MKLSIFQRKDEELVFYTELSVDECSRRLEKLTDKENFFYLDFARCKEIISKVDANKFRLRVNKKYLTRKRIDPRYTTVFYGQLNKVNNRTEIKGYFCLHPFLRSFLNIFFIFFLGLLFLSGIILIISIINNIFNGKYLLNWNLGIKLIAHGIAFCIILIVLYFITVKTNNWIRRIENECAKNIVGFLQDALEASKVN